MVGCPSGGAFAHPSDGIDHLFMGHLDRPEKNGLMVRDTIS
jgi:hypothetical protein